MYKIQVSANTSCIYDYMAISVVSNLKINSGAIK